MSPRTPGTPAALLLAALTTLAFTAACSSADESSSASPEPASSNSATESGTGDVDPLAGEWRTSFTCEDAVRAVEKRLGDEWGGWSPEEAAPGEPCAGGEDRTELIARFADGAMALCQPTGACEVHATYDYPEAAVIRIDDTEGNLCEPGKTCPVDWTYVLSGDELTFRTADDAWTISGWEAAPWVRSS